MITIKVLRCKNCGHVLTEKWTAEKAKENWYCEECAKKDCAPVKMISKKDSTKNQLCQRYINTAMVLAQYL